jgi:hypothetical protein
MPLHPTRTKPTTDHLAGYWRLCYAWRWNQPHPAPKAQLRHYFMRANTVLKAFRDGTGLDKEATKNFITWFWCWYTFRHPVAPQHTEDPSPVNWIGGQQQDRFVFQAYKLWVEHRP